MKRPNVIIRRGDRFQVDERKLYPHLKREEDMVRSALYMASLHYKSYPTQYTGMSAKDKLDKINDMFYQFLKDWGVYKGK